MTGERRTRIVVKRDENDKLSVDFIPPEDNGAEAASDDRPTCQVEPIERGYDLEPTDVTKKYKDPTLGVMAAEYALYGHTYVGRHVFGEE